MNIPLSNPDITDAEIEEIVAVLRTGRLSLGPKLEEFESLVGDYVTVPHAVAVSSGTAGLHLCFRALGIGPGDEVIVPSFTFIAAANSIRYEGATPVFVDVDPVTLNLDPNRVREAITPATRAILVVHTFGVPAAMRELLAIAAKHGLRVIEDACEALGAEYDGHKTGSFGDAAVFAFYPNKQITTGEGGMVVTRDAGLARDLRALRNQGRYPSDDWHQHSVLGFNYRISEINCALGCAQMRRIDAILQSREQVAARYSAALRTCPQLVLPFRELAGCRISWFVYVVRLASHLARADRDRSMQALLDAGIGCGRYFAPVHTQPAYRGFAIKQALPVTEATSERALALPFFNRLTPGQIDEVASTLRSSLPG